MRYLKFWQIWFNTEFCKSAANLNQPTHEHFQVRHRVVTVIASQLPDYISITKRKTCHLLEKIFTCFQKIKVIKPD